MLRLVDNLLYPIGPGGCQQVYGLTAGWLILIFTISPSYIWC